MTSTTNSPGIVGALAEEERCLVRLAAAIAAGGEEELRQHVQVAVTSIRPEWVEEVVLQSYLFAGFPRALNAAREWRRASARSAPATDSGEAYSRHEMWTAQGEDTCAVVYGPSYAPLRRHIRELHPALDAWMIVEGYGKVLSRQGLDLARRELCIVAACAASRQWRQLHSHLHGALHAGASVEAVTDTLDALASLLSPDDAAHCRMLWDKVRTSPRHVH